MIDVRLAFRKKLGYTSRKPVGATTALAKMWPNIGEPKHGRLLLGGMMRSFMLHASPVWAEVLTTSQRR